MASPRISESSKEMATTEMFCGDELVVLFVCGDVYDIRRNEEHLPKGSTIMATYVRVPNGVKGSAYATSDDRLIDELCVEISNHLTSRTDTSLFHEVRAGLDSFKRGSFDRELRIIEVTAPVDLKVPMQILIDTANADNLSARDLAALAAKFSDPALITLTTIVANATDEVVRTRATEWFHVRLREGAGFSEISFAEKSAEFTLAAKRAELERQRRSCVAEIKFATGEANTSLDLVKRAFGERDRDDATHRLMAINARLAELS